MRLQGLVPEAPEEDEETPAANHFRHRSLKQPGFDQITLREIPESSENNDLKPISRNVEGLVLPSISTIIDDRAQWMTLSLRSHSCKPPPTSQGFPFGHIPDRTSSKIGFISPRFTGMSDSGLQARMSSKVFFIETEQTLPSISINRVRIIERNSMTSPKKQADRLNKLKFTAIRKLETEGASNSQTRMTLGSRM